MLKCKFEQQCPVYSVRVSSYTFGSSRSSGPASTTTTTTTTIENNNSSSGNSSSARPARKSEYSLLTDTAVLELAQMKKLMESKNREVCSYKKTIETLTEELDGLRARVKDLEQSKKEARMSATTTGQEVMRELEREKAEREKLKGLLEAETEKV